MLDLPPSFLRFDGLLSTPSSGLAVTLTMLHLGAHLRPIRVGKRGGVPIANRLHIRCDGKIRGTGADGAVQRF